MADFWFMKNWKQFQASRSILRQLSNDLEEAESRRAAQGESGDAKEATFWMRFPGSGVRGEGQQSHVLEPSRFLRSVLVSSQPLGRGCEWGLHLGRNSRFRNDEN